MTLTEQLARARTAGIAADFDVDLLPAETEEAYAEALGALAGGNIAAWKIGGANAWSQKVFGNAELFFGPLMADEVAFDSESYSLAGLVSPLAEPEIMLELGEWPMDEVGPVFTRMALGVEIPASVLPAEAKTRLTGQILDRAGAGGLWIGAPRPFDGRSLAENFSISFRCDDQPERIGHAGNVFGGPVGSALLFLGQVLRRGVTLQPGQWIATGGLVPAIPVESGMRLTAEAADIHIEMCFD